jgi:hypothetical protein
MFRSSYKTICARAGAACAIAVLGLAGLGSTAHASCAIPIAGEQPDFGPPRPPALPGFGTSAVLATGCMLDASAGGEGASTASVPLGAQQMSASANLASGVLTAYSAGGFASAAEWDTFTFSGLPAGGETIAVTLSLSGTFTGDGTGIAEIRAGPSATFGDLSTVTQGTLFGNGIPVPASIMVQVTVTDTSSLTVLSEIEADGFAGNIADMTDPPTLTLDLPAGVTATSSSGVFTNFEPLTLVPEPSAMLLLLGGLAALVQARRGRQSRSVRRIV